MYILASLYDIFDSLISRFLVLRVYIFLLIAVKKKQLFYETIRYSDIGAHIPILNTDAPILTQPTTNSTDNTAPSNTTLNPKNISCEPDVDIVQPASSHSKPWRCDCMSGEDNSCCGFGKSDILKRWRTKLCEYYSWLCGTVDVESSHANPLDQRL